MPTLSTGDIAERADVNVHTVRYYEERELPPPVPRSVAGHRRFGDQHLSHIRFVKRPQQLGFTLEEIRGLLSPRADERRSRWAAVCSSPSRCSRTTGPTSRGSGPCSWSERR